MIFATTKKCIVFPVCFVVNSFFSVVEALKIFEHRYLKSCLYVADSGSNFLSFVFIIRGKVKLLFAIPRKLSFGVDERISICELDRSRKVVAAAVSNLRRISSRFQLLLRTIWQILSAFIDSLFVGNLFQSYRFSFTLLSLNSRVYHQVSTRKQLSFGILWARKLSGLQKSPHRYVPKVEVGSRRSRLCFFPKTFR